MNILKESIDELAAKNSGLYTDVIMFLLVCTFFFFPNVFTESKAGFLHA